MSTESDEPAFSELSESERTMKIAGLLMAGFNDDTALKHLGWTFEEYTATKRLLFERETAQLKTRTSYDHYLDYFFAQRSIINELQIISQAASDGPRPSEAVSSLKAMSDITDRILRVGQDLGVIDRKAIETKSFNLHGVTGIDELKRILVKEQKEIAALLESSAPMGDVVVPAIHRPGPKKLPAPVVVDAEIVEAAPAKKKPVRVVKKAAPAPAP